MTNTTRIPVYAQSSHDYLTSSDHTHYSFSPAKGHVHCYVEPMHGQQTDLIDMSSEDSRLIGYIVAPQGSKAHDDDAVPYLTMPGWQSRFLIYEAVDCAKEHECGLRWKRASA